MKFLHHTAAVAGFVHCLIMSLTRLKIDLQAFQIAENMVIELHFEGFKLELNDR